MVGMAVLLPQRCILVRFFLDPSLYLVVVLIIHCTDVLDGAMVVLAIYALNIAHPGILLAEDHKPGLEKEVSA